MSRHQDTLTRFRTIPKTGTTLDTPLTGWRYEWTDGTRLWNYTDTTARAARCTLRPRGPGTALAQHSDHPAPHWGCVCGFRVVGDLEVLHTYTERLLQFTETVGLDREQPQGATGLVITKVEVTGYVTPAVPDWHVDPPFTVRTGTMRLIEVHAPDWIDRPRLARMNPGVTVRAMDGLPRGLFPSVRMGPRPAPVLSIEAKGDAARIVLGIGPVVIPREALRGTEIHAAVMGVAHPNGDIQDCLATVIDRLVKPHRPDITTPADQEAAAFGIAWTLALMAEGNTTA
ncbi:MAG: hypothetical protein QJR09_13580 [Micrococcus sp.]|nr:hypothetical protein [Micrococcus sp.]